MSTTPPAPTAPPPSRPRRRRWLLVPAFLLAAFLLALAVLYIRGTWADTTPREPAKGQGAVSYLYQGPDGHKSVRAAILLPYPRDKVWALVTGYDRYGELLPYLKDVTAERKDDTVHLTGQARSAFQGYWPFAIDVHEDTSGERWTVSWDSPGEPVVVNRGGWTVTEKGPEETELELSLEAEVKGYPTFFLRNFFLRRLRRVLQAVDTQLQHDRAVSPAAGRQD